MRLKEYIFWIVVGLMSVPGVMGAVSDYPVDEGYTYAVVTYPLGVYNVDLENPSAGEIVNNTYNATKLHNTDVIEHRLVFTIEVSATYTPDSGETGTWMISWDQDDTALGTCQNEILTRPPGGFLVGDLPFQATDTRHCLRVGSEAKNNINHTHTLTADLSAVNNPASLEHLGISVLIEREDIYLIPQTITIEPFDVYIPVAFFLGLMIWSLWNGYRLPAIAATIGALGVFMPISISAAGSVYAFVLFIWLTYYVRKKNQLGILEGE